MPQSHLYTPTYTLKPFGENIWIVDGEIISFYGLPFTTRMTVVKLPSGDLWIHSPIHLTDELKKELDNLGPVKYLISPNKIHYWYLDEFQESYPQAITYASPGVRQRATKAKPNIRFDEDLVDLKSDFWESELEMEILQGSRYMQEAVFFHKLSKTLIVTDIIENFESQKINPFFRVLAYLGGALAPNGGTTIDQQLTYFGNHAQIQSSVEKILSWQPEKIILAHGKCIEQNATDELKRVFGWV